MKQQKSSTKEPNPVLAAWLDSPGLLFEAPKPTQTTERSAAATTAAAAPAPAATPGPSSDSTATQHDQATAPTSSAAASLGSPHGQHAQQEESASNPTLAARSSDRHELLSEAKPVFKEQTVHAWAPDAQEPGSSLNPAQPRPTHQRHSSLDSQSQCMDVALHHYMELVQRESNRQKAREARAREATTRRLKWVRRFNRLAWMVTALLAALYFQSRSGSPSAVAPAVGVVLLSVAVSVCGGAYVVERQMVSFVGAAGQLSGRELKARE